MPTCHDVCKAALAERAKYPLNEGRYKLKEAGQVIEGWHKLVVTVGNRVRTGGKFGLEENLGPCMAHERGTYLKSIPTRLAELIGYKILPGIAALEGDGVPKAEVKRLLSIAESDAQRLLAECEAVRLRLKGGIDSEYDAMRRGENRLSSLLEGAQTLARSYSLLPVTKGV